MKIIMKTAVAAVIAFVGLTAAAQAVTTPKYNEFYWQRASLFDVLPVDSTAIVMLGNSLTNGAEWHELFNDHRVVNRGITGDIVQGVKDRLAPVVQGHPDKIFLIIGANDISHHLTADSIAGAIVDLVRTIRKESPRTRLYVESVLPINNSFGRYKNMKDKEPVIKEINTIIAPLVQQEGATWLDITPLFSDADGNLDARYTNDGLHLLGPGYIVWRDFLAPYVKE